MSALDYPRRSPQVATELRDLRSVARTFLGEDAPRVILVGAGVVGVLRLFVGQFGWVDAVAASLAVVLVGFVEWFIHVHWLHAPDTSVRMKKWRSGVSHRQHHVEPDTVGFLLLTGPDAASYMAVLVAWHATWPLLLAWGLGASLVGTYLTALGTSYLLLAYYEWLHLLIHSSYRPRSSYFKRVAAHHRLHHYRNENYWMGVTSRLGDRVLGTSPKSKTDVPISGTARSLSSSTASSLMR